MKNINVGARVINWSYHKSISDLADCSSNQRVLNSKPKHAVAFFVNMFRHAKRCVRIFSDFRDDTFGNRKLRLAAQQYVSDPTHELKLLFQLPPNFKQSPVETVRSCSFISYLDPIDHEIRVAQGNYADPNIQQFAIIDERGFRYEAEGKRICVANFNEPETARKLARAFDEAFEMGRELDLSTRILREQALAKLTPEEIKASGLR